MFQAIQFTQTVLIQTIQFSISRVSMSKIFLFQTIQFIYIYIYIYIYIVVIVTKVANVASAIKYTDCISAEE